MGKVDILSLHIPLNEGTQHLMNRETLRMMKEDAILINTARGGHIHEQNLADHLVAHPNFTALLDVLSEEPASSDNPLIGLHNCKITPHQAWAGYAARQKLMKLMVDALEQFKLTGGGSLA